MSVTDSDTDPSEGGRDENADLETLRTKLTVLREENERLRAEYARARKASYRRSATGLLAVGFGAVLAGTVLEGVREVLLVLGAIGIFGGVLTWYLTPDRVLSVAVSESIYRALAANGSQLRDELGLQSTLLYVPTDTGVRVVVPQHPEFELPESLTDVFLTDTEVSRGVSLTPSGQALVDEIERTANQEPSRSLRAAVTQFGEALVEQFEIADAVTVTESEGDDRVVVSIAGASFGSLAEFDHPAVSVVGCGLARARDEPIAVRDVDETTVAFEPISH